MSQDIRSFFTTAMKKKGDAPKQDLSPVKKKTSRRKRVIIESDSDDDRSPPKRTKVSPRSKKESTKIKKKESPTKSKYFETSAQNMFGGEPIKRIPPKKKVKEVPDPEVVEIIQSDSDFEAALLQMDEIDPDEWEKKPNDTLPAKKPSNVTPIKKENLEYGGIGKSNSIRSLFSEKSHCESPIKKQKFSSVEGEKSSPVHNLSPEQSPYKNRVKKDKSAPSDTGKFHSLSPENSPHKIVNNKEEMKIITNNNNANVQNKKEIQICDKEEKSNKKFGLSKNRKAGQIDDVLPKKIPHTNVNDVKISGEKKKARMPTKIDNSSSANRISSRETEGSSLWVDKYRPKNLKHIVGQQGDKSNVKKLVSWLQNWHKNNSNNKKRFRPSPWTKDDNGAFFKAALLSGPPGVGKTTTAHLVCKELGFDLVEFNASDTRSKKMLHQEISELLSTKSLTPYFTGGGTQGNVVSKNHVLVMDEVDGMAGNEDRGGVQELIQLVKTTRIPIICMCNDRNHPKIRSLANYCYDLRFHRPRVEQIRGAMMSVCCKENLKMAPNTLSDIISCANQDIRLVLNHLSMLAAQRSGLENSKKHIKLGPWDVVRLVFSEQEHKTMSIYDKCDLFFHDYSIGPLFVQENYLNVAPHSEKAKNKRKKMELFAQTAHSLSLGDVTDKVIRTRNAWSLLPTQAIFSSFIPGQILEGHMTGQINFPSWLGKNSKRGKLDRLLQEVQVHTRLRVSGSKEAINLDYLVPLRDLIVRPLLQHGSEGINTALSSLQEYNLVKEDFDSLNELCLWPSSKDPMAKVESKVKAAFTRAYNKSGMLPPYAMSSVVKKGKSASGIEDGLENEEEIEEREEEDEESIEVDAMITMKKKQSKRRALESVASTSRGKDGSGKRTKNKKK